MENRTGSGLAWRRRPAAAEAAGSAFVDSPNFRTQILAVAFAEGACKAVHETPSHGLQQR
jgi:hypothetical protein